MRPVAAHCGFVMFQYTSDMTTTVTTTGAFTIEDLEGFPSDGNRYELIEGSLHVTPSPLFNHQRVVSNVFFLLRSACPPEFEVLVSPLDVVLGVDTVVQPDILVIPVAPPGTRRLEQAPLLAVEVQSPSTRLYDLGTKRMVYEEAGVGAYWVVAPSGPSIAEWRWPASGVAGGTGQERTVEGDDEFVADWPFSVSAVPSRLLLPGG